LVRAERRERKRGGRGVANEREGDEVYFLRMIRKIRCVVKQKKKNLTISGQKKQEKGSERGKGGSIREARWGASFKKKRKRDS